MFINAMGKIHGAVICTVLYSIYNDLIDVVNNRLNVDCVSDRHSNAGGYVNVWCVNFNSII